MFDLQLFVCLLAEFEDKLIMFANEQQGRRLNSGRQEWDLVNDFVRSIISQLVVMISFMFTQDSLLVLALPFGLAR